MHQCSCVHVDDYYYILGTSHVVVHYARDACPAPHRHIWIFVMPSAPHVYDGLYCVRTSASFSTVTCSLDSRVVTASSGISALLALSAY